MALHENRIVLVTGAASGIGRAAALAFAREGGEETAGLIRNAGGEALFVHADMADHASIRAMVDGVAGHFGGLDVAFNNAGHRGGLTNLVDCDEAEWDLVMQINLKAVWLCMKYQIPQMIKRGGGAIVNTASAMAGFAGPCMLSYTTSKHGVLGLTRSAAVDFGPQGVRVNALLPGATDTQMLRDTMANVKQSSGSADRIPLRRLSRPEEQAEAAVWLASDRASFVTGEAFVVDGGVTALR